MQNYKIPLKIPPESVGIFLPDGLLAASGSLVSLAGGSGMLYAEYRSGVVTDSAIALCVLRRGRMLQSTGWMTDGK